MSSDGGQNIHYVCTHEEGWQIVEKNQHFWLSNCGCREQKGHCRRSRIDICLDFQERNTGGGSGLHEVGKEDVKDVFAEAKEKHLVVRPFRDDTDRTEVAGICFCCDDCCGYFLDPSEKCDKGSHVQTTDFAGCTHCGDCVDVCYFGVRKMVKEKLEIVPERCYGCGLCTDVCPTSCIMMTIRTGS
ncbi:MAG: 4Fe-4S binding protein [candidate division WOR-3 bacterium]|nr:MAG: 4Fe-4S binding protein [candidate division WOR-3 bacterium]